MKEMEGMLEVKGEERLTGGWGSCGRGLQNRQGDGRPSPARSSWRLVWTLLVRDGSLNLGVLISAFPEMCILKCQRRSTIKETDCICWSGVDLSPLAHLVTLDLFHPGQWFLTGGHCAYRGHETMSGVIFGCHNFWGLCYWP